MSGRNLTWRAKLTRHFGLVLFLSVLMTMGAGEGCGRETIFVGRVEKVIDGDSLLLQSGGKRVEVRFWGIDCPEYGQPYGSAAKRLSRELLSGRMVKITAKTRDSYGRVVGRVQRGDLDVNAELVKQGAAWVYSRYCRETPCGEWQRLEDLARTARRGLWTEQKPTPPWTWRRHSK